ncbi:uncharacterized protein LOC107365473 [Tetranychus urticae]|nr:uncharacterized protein LOC107365473 [Tetranychus urticae]
MKGLNITTFKVKHLDEYHDIVIDWNDNRYEYKYQQLFEQLESITGVPNRYIHELGLVRPYPTTLPGIVCYVNEERIQGIDIHGARIRNGECFRLKCWLKFEWFKYNRILMNYKLVAEDSIPEGACTYDFCQHQFNATYFKRLKDIVNNDELNAKVSQLIRSLRRISYVTSDNIFRKFNILQYICVQCVVYEMLFYDSIVPRPLYLRCAG